jgi:ribosomal protein S18 acetylase RimI-like enzyme
MIRAACLGDLDALLAIEHASFATDRLSQRSLRHLLTKGNALALVETRAGQLRGYVLMLFHVDHAVARLYSIAVARRWQGRQIAGALVAAAEARARERRCRALRLEVRKDNAPSLALFTRAGYARFGEHPHYYADGMDALRLEKSLRVRAGSFAMAAGAARRVAIDFT